MTETRAPTWTDHNPVSTLVQSSPPSLPGHFGVTKCIANIKYIQFEGFILKPATFYENVSFTLT